MGFLDLICMHFQKQLVESLKLYAELQKCNLRHDQLHNDNEFEFDHF